MLPNHFPTSGNGLAVVGDFPSLDDLNQGEIFFSSAGRYLKAALRLADIDPNQCFYGNVSQVKAPSGDFKKLSYNTPEIQMGLNQLREDLEVYKPTMVVCLGNLPLRYFFPASSGVSVGTHRGTLFLSSPLSPCPNTKTMGTYHPITLFKVYEWSPLFLLDLKRARKHLDMGPSLTLPSRFIQTGPDLTNILIQLRRCKTEKKPLSVDIEGYVNGMHCIGFARSPFDAFVVPLLHRDHQPVWSKEDEFTIIRALADVLEDPTIPKILQSSLYDNFVLSWTYKIPIRGVADDTLLKHWEKYPELDKNLGLQTSIYTEEPYYKDERTGTDNKTYWTYCGKDCCVTHEINTVLSQQLTDPRGVDHYRFNMALLNPLLYMELRGIRYDNKRAVEKRASVLRTLYAAQHEIDVIAKLAIDPSRVDQMGLISQTAESCCSKKASKRGIYTPADVASNLLAPYRPYAERIQALLTAYPNWSKEDNGEFCVLTDRGMNIRSKDFKPWFYEKCSEPIQTTDAGNPTVDYETVLRIFKRTGLPLCKHVLTVGDARTHEQMLAITSDLDGRIRCAYNPVGTVTGRVSSYTSPTGSGYNLQTIPEYDRDLFLADEGYEFFQCDLSGADAWTIAAHCKSLSDSTMLDDLMAGVKIAKVIACMFLDGPEVSLLPRDELARYTAKIKKDDPIYFGAKCCQHGSNLGMHKNLMSYTIFKQSAGDVDVPAHTCERLQNLYFKRYWGVPLYQRRVIGNIKQHKAITSGNGHTRLVFGRPEDDQTHKALFAEEPQQMTTYATNRAALALWNDPENRRPDGSLIIEPLHQVHDALCGQWPADKREWAIKKVRSYFQNPVTIAGVTLTIPFEGTYGPAWGGTKYGEFK